MLTTTYAHVLKHSLGLLAPMPSSPRWISFIEPTPKRRRGPTGLMTVDELLRLAANRGPSGNRPDDGAVALRAKDKAIYIFFHLRHHRHPKAR